MVPSLRSIARQLTPTSVLRQRARARLAREVATSGEPELAELSRFVQPGDLCLDVGASVGVYAYALAELGARVIALEPNPAVASYVELIGSDRIEVRRIALAASDGTGTLSIPGDTGEATLRADAFTGNATTTTVPTRSLDGLGLEPLAFVKIDVEGYEEAVLDGGMATIARDLPVLLIEIEERHNAGGLARIVARLGALDYSCVFLLDGRWAPVGAFDAAVHQRVAALAPMVAGGGRRDCAYYNNFLFLPAGRTVPGIN